MYSAHIDSFVITALIWIWVFSSTHAAQVFLCPSH